MQSVSVNPSSVTGGAASTGTVALTSAAPAGGITVSVSSSDPSAQVPAGGTLTVPEGATSATFQITTSAVSVITPVTISASYSGSTPSATLTVNPPPALQSVGVNPSAVTGGQPSTGTVTLTSAAPAGGTVVNLSSDNAAAQVPAGGSLTVAAGATTADFTITTSGVISTTTATVSASYSGVTKTASLTINPLPSLQSVGVNPSSVTGGSSSTGTVTLSSAAPSGGTVVNLSSDNAAAQVPAGGSVTVAAGATTADFSITTSGVISATTATISASLNGSTKTAGLTINPPATSPPLSVVQAQQSFNANSGITSLTANLSSTAGSLLVAFVREGTNATDNFTVSDNLGQSWTLAGYNSFGATNRSAIFYMANSAAVSSVTATFTTSGGVVRPGIVVYEIAGAATSSVVDAGPLMNTFSTNQTSLTSAPLTTSSTNDILIFAVDLSVSQSGTNNSFVPGPGFVFPATGSANDPRQAVSYEVVSTGQTNLTTSMSWGTTAGAGTSQFIAFKAATTSAIAQVSPRASALTFINTQQYTTNISSPTWSVDGVAGGSASSGMITALGLYTPPSSVGTHTITATGSSGSASATAYITNYGGTFTLHNDNMRTGQNLNETVLTTANVNSAQFGKLFSYGADGYVRGQPLYMPNVSIPGQGNHNVVYITTEHDSVYAFDADGLQSTPLWHVSFINPSAGITTMPGSDVNVPNEVGITGSPVIDPSTGTLYVSAKTKEVSGGTTNYVQRLHALDITTGAEKFGGPVVIQPQVPGTAPDAVNGMVSFDAKTANQREALLLANGAVYVTFASFGDNFPTAYHGWVVGYNATTLQQTMAFNDSPNGQQGGIWQSACGPSADATYIYAITGNGTFDTTTPRADYGDSFVKLTSTGSVADFFTPSNQSSLSSSDLDLGTAGDLVLPDQPGSFPHLMVSVGKQGTVYLVNRDNLGQYNASSNNVVQSLVTVMNGVWSCPVYWQGYVYFSPDSSPLRAYQLSNGLLSTSPTSQSGPTFTRSTPTLSANGATNGILWQTNWSSDTTPGVLYAFDATNLSKELYDTTQVASRDQLDSPVKFNVPTVANGRVYLGMKSSVVVLGLLP